MKKSLAILMISSLVLSLNTKSQCTAPINLVSGYANNVSTFTWDSVPGAVEYFFEIDFAGGDWSFGATSTSTNSYSLTGLMQGGNFQWRITANCGTGSATSATVFFNTPCAPPFGLSATSITTNSAVLNWLQSTTDNNNNTGFSVSYRRANTNNTWTQLTNTTNNPTATFLNLSGLIAGTAYEWRVRRVCSAANSNYVYGSFVTLSCISNGTNNNEWIDLFVLGTINRVSGAETGGYANLALSTNLIIGSTNAAQISAGFSGQQRNQQFSVYIDFNRNGSFADAGERLINGSGINNAGIKNFNVNIPANVTAGATRMRVILRRNGGNITPCVTGYFGETEDYVVNLVIHGNFRAISEDPKPGILRQPKESIFSKPKEIKPVIAVSPNPSPGVFTITLPANKEIISYQLTDVNGRMVLRNSGANKKQITINIGNERAGIYLFSITGKDGKQQSVKLLRL